MKRVPIVSGFSLIEVLVSLVLILIGLLGFSRCY